MCVLKNSFLLKSKRAEKLYNDFAKGLPIIDFHNHISMQDVASDRRFSTLTEVWITPDPYKHRLMRICGVDEYYITGKASDFEKFEKFCEIFYLLAGNPVYDWAKMELSTVFGVDDELCKKNAKVIYDIVNEKLANKEFSHNGILAKFNVEYHSPVATLLDDLSCFSIDGVAPSLRGDNLLCPTEEIKNQLKHLTGREVDTVDEYVQAIDVVLEKFDNAGCRFADHALDAGFFEDADACQKVEILTKLGVLYAKRGWTLLLHLDAKRKTSSRLLKIAGPAGGYAAVGGNFNISAVCDLLGSMESAGGLPDTVVFPLNMSDQAPLAVMQGSFSQDGVASKVQLGPAWWWCDHALGITNTLNCIANFGAVSQFIGMTTDSRSVLSFVRHDYFRRIVCNWLVEKDQECEWGLSDENLGEIVQKICYKNALSKIKK